MVPDHRFEALSAPCAHDETFLFTPNLLGTKVTRHTGALPYDCGHIRPAHRWFRAWLSMVSAVPDAWCCLLGSGTSDRSAGYDWLVTSSGALSGLAGGVRMTGHGDR